MLMSSLFLTSLHSSLQFTVQFSLTAPYYPTLWMLHNLFLIDSWFVSIFFLCDPRKWVSLFAYPGVGDG